MEEIYSLDFTDDMLNVTKGLHIDQEMSALKLLYCN